MNTLQSFLFWIKPRSTTDGIITAVFFCMVPFLFIGSLGDSEYRFVRTLWNFGHVIFFGVFTFLVIYRVKINTLPHVLVVLCVVFFAGSLVEILQMLTSRSSDFFDVIANLVGSLLVLCWYWRPSLLVWLGRILTTTLAVLPFMPIIYTAGWEAMFLLRFPTIASFELPYEEIIWRGNNEKTVVEEFPSDGKHSLRVELNTGRFSGISLRAMPKNWSKYRTFKFDIYNPDDQSLMAYVRVHDSKYRRSRTGYDDRFNPEVEIRPGWNYFSFSLEDVKNAPVHRQMDMTSIEDIGLFTISLPAPRVIYTDNWRLE